MPFYIRKSVKIGPLRLNLSKSGAGISAGVKGFRLGSGPRGNYIHVGRGGLYYRKTIGKRQPTNRISSNPVKQNTSGATNDIEMVEIDSANLQNMKDASDTDILSDLNATQRRSKIAPWIAALSIAALLDLWYNTASPATHLFATLSAMCFVLSTHLMDRRRKTALILYNLESGAENAYRKVNETFEKLNSANRKWHIDASGTARDSKYHAGAGTIIRRTTVEFDSKPPAFVRTNIPVPTIPVGKQILCFFPDRLLVFDGPSTGAVPYNSLRIDVQATRFIEAEKPPPDGEIVGTTWRYANKDGGPDRRFKDNEELPILIYDDIHFSSPSGLNELIQISRSGIAIEFANAVKELSNQLVPATGNATTRSL